MMVAAGSVDATTSTREHNRRVVRDFFRFFSRDWNEFRALWAVDPVIEIPFAPPGMGQYFEGDAGFDDFWKPIFEMQGVFDWVIDHEIIGENPDEIVVQSRSDVDVTVGDANIAYSGRYIQIFAFSDGRIARFTEYVDSHFMGKKYGLL